MQRRFRKKFLDLNAFYSDLVRRVVWACDGLLPVEHRHLHLLLSWSLEMLCKKTSSEKHTPKSQNTPRGT